MAPRRDVAERMESRIPVLGVVAPPPILVETPVFEGSLAMLFKCVRDGKVSLLEVPLAPICEAYFAYLVQANLGDLDQAASALAALSYLIERKAWLLLPTPEPEPEQIDAAGLPEPTAHRYQVVVEALHIFQGEREQLFFRTAEAGPDPYELPYTLGNVDAKDLALALERLLRRAVPDSLQHVTRPQRSLADTMVDVLRGLTLEWRSLDLLVPEPFTRQEALFWFLALLELIRLGQATVRLQDGDVQFARAK